MTISFQDLGLSATRVQQLEALGFTEPTAIQTKTIPLILQGHDVVGQSQTGTGKTAAYSLPILQQVDPDNSTVQALVLTPTRELAQQVATAIRDFSGGRRPHILTVYGGQPIERQIHSLERGVQIVVGTPGRIIDLIERRKLKLEQLRWAVLDEADEMLSMGFIDDVKRILKQTPENRQTVCFSATMPREIQDLVSQFLRSPVPVKIEQAQTTPAKIEQHAYFVPRGWSKIRALQPILEVENPSAALIFVRTKHSAAELTSRLQEAGQSVDEYHGNLNQSQRERLLQRFRDGKVKLVVATDIAARGLDVENMTHVINFDLPDNAETYIHRIGRTGRAGKTGKAIAILDTIDRRMLRQIERRLKHPLEVRSIPSRTEVEARRVEKLQSQIRETLAGERMASFLPIVRELSEEYDPQAIAAAALQIVYDQDCPNWMKGDWQVPNAENFNKPTPKRKFGKSNRQFDRKPIAQNS